MLLIFRLFFFAIGLAVLAVALLARGLVPEPAFRTRIGEVPSLSRPLMQQLIIAPTEWERRFVVSAAGQAEEQDGAPEPAKLAEIAPPVQAGARTPADPGTDEASRVVYVSPVIWSQAPRSDPLTELIRAVRAETSDLALPSRRIAGIARGLAAGEPPALAFGVDEPTNEARAGTDSVGNGVEAPKPPARRQAKAEPGAEATAETQGEAQAEPGAEVAAETRGETKAEPGAEVAAETRGETKAEPGAEVAAETRGEAKAEPGAEVAAEIKGQAKDETGAAAIAKREGQAKAKTEKKAAVSPPAKASKTKYRRKSVRRGRTTRSSKRKAAGRSVVKSQRKKAKRAQSTQRAKKRTTQRTKRRKVRSKVASRTTRTSNRTYLGRPADSVYRFDPPKPYRYYLVPPYRANRTNAR